MKKIILLSFVMIIALSNSYSQNPVPNPGFENWANGEPDNWFTSNIPGFLVLVTQSSDAHTGSSCARGDVDTIFANAVGPILFSTVNGRGFPVSQNYTTLEFWYKLNSVSGDLLDAVIGMNDASGSGIGVGAMEFPAQSAYTHAAVPIFYAPGTADSANIIISIVGATDSVHLGSFMEIDDVSLTNNPTSVGSQSLSSVQSFTVFPDPAKSAATLGYFITRQVSLEVSLFNVAGQRVYFSTNNALPGRHQEKLDVSRLTPGVYLCQLKAGNDIVKKAISVMR